MKRDIPIIFALLAVIAAAFWGLGACGFINFDDPTYVIENPHVTGGLTWANFKWAWTAIHASNYHPLTWLSLMVDASLFGTGPRGFHWVNLAFHAVNAVLVYLWFRLATGSVWRSATLAAVFAVHPLRVESVAWISERKDVLAAFFGLLAMLAYLRYARTLRWTWYLTVLGLFAAALLAKQSVATFPFLFLLLDFWPLGRWARGPAPASLSDACVPRTVLSRLVLEKLPFLAMVAGISFLTVKAQSSTQTIISLDVLPLVDRLANMPVSYVRYLGKMVWFGNLAVYYPRQAWGLARVAGACALLAAITWVAVARRRSSPWLAVGWFWFLGVLVPMIGLVQVASQSMADRYTYLSGIGILLMVVWSVHRSFVRRLPTLTVASAAAVLAILCLFTLVQIGYWRNSVILFTHDIEVAGSSTVAENNLGNALVERAEYSRAVPHLQAAVDLSPTLAITHYNLATALLWAGRPREAYPHILAALRLDPSRAKSHGLLASLMNATGNFQAAESEAKAAINLAPRLAEAYNDLGVALLHLGKPDEAADQFRLALSMEPGLVASQQNLTSMHEEQDRQFATRAMEADGSTRPATGPTQ